MVAGIHDPIIIAVDAKAGILLVSPFRRTPRALMLVLPIAGCVQEVLLTV
jgi:hypothetical protein